MTTANPVQGQVPPNPPGAPPQGGPPQPQQPPQRPLPPSVTHQLGIEATPSKKEPQATASFQKQDQEREITVKKQLDWSGQKYTFTIHLPLENPLHTMSKSERMQFQKQADDLAELMIQDLKQQLDAQYKNGKASGKKKIEPGDNCRILFDDSGKYIIAHEDDVSSIDPDKPDTFNDKRAYEANGPTSKQIVLAACSKKAEKMYQCLQHESLKPLRMATQKKTAEQAADASPVNLIFKKNSCFIDAPFQQLVTDPTVAKDLINPDYYKDGTDSALYKAVTAYRAAQLKGERVDVASILRNKGLDASGKQLDALLDGWYRFADFFNFDAIPEESKLHDLFTKPCVFTLGKGGKLNDLASAAIGNQKPGEVLCLRAQDRVIWDYPDEDLQTACSETTESSDEDECRTAHGDTEEEQSGVNGNSEEKEISSTNSRSLTEENLKQLGLRPSLPPAQKSPQKNKALVDIDPSGKVTINSKKYDLASFIFHTGEEAESGHYITYVRKGDQCYKLDDRESSPQPVNLKAFLERAKGASMYILHQEGLTDVKKTRAAQENKATEPETPPIEPIPDLETPKDAKNNCIKVGHGSMKALPKTCILVHPSNRNFQFTHPQIDEVVPHLQEKIGTQVAATESGWHFWRKSFTERSRLPGPFSGPDCLLTNVDGHKILNVPLRHESPQQDVEDMLDECVKQNYHHVAIPCEADEAQVDQLRQAIGIYFATHKDCRQLTVEIVLPKPLPAASNLPPQGVAPTSGTDDEGTVNASDDESNTDVSET